MIKLIISNLSSRALAQLNAGAWCFSDRPGRCTPRAAGCRCQCRAGDPLFASGTQGGSGTPLFKHFS